MWIPGALALLQEQGPRRLRGLGFSLRPNRWFLTAWLLPLGLVLCAVAASALLPEISFSASLPRLEQQLRASLPPEEAESSLRLLIGLGPGVLLFGMIAGALIAGPTINAAAALGEELAWRGLMQRELSGLGFWKSSAVIGVLWGLWHLPLILHGHNYPQHSAAGVAMMTAFTVLFSPILAYLRIRAESVVAPAIAHGVLNASGGMIFLLEGGDDLTIGITGWVGLAVLAAADLALFLYLRVASRP